MRSGSTKCKHLEAVSHTVSLCECRPIRETLIHKMPSLLAITALPILVVLTVTGCNAEVAVQVVSYNESVGGYQLNEPALHIIERLPSPVRVLAVVGDARIGKSTFLNMVHLHWNPSVIPGGETLPFEVGSTTQVCTLGVWVHVRRLPEGGSLVLVDVEGANLGNDTVTEQLSALIAVVSSYILLFVREVVNNAALEFLYHTAKLGKLFPDSDTFPHLGVAIRDALDVSSKFPDRQSEVVYHITDPTHKDGNDDIRREIAAVFLPVQITAFDIKYQDKNQLQNLQSLNSGPYLESVKRIIHDLKRIMPSKLTPNGMEMCGGDLVEMIRRLFTALENGDVTVLETAFKRLEKQMCDGYYSEWIPPLLRMSEDDYMSKYQYHLEEFGKLCKVESYMQRVQEEVDTKTNGIIREREEREKRRKAEEERQKAEEERRKAEEARRKAEEEKRKQEVLKREAELALLKEKEEKKRAEQQAAIEKARAEEKRRKEEEKKRQLEERLKEEQRRAQAAQQELSRRRRKKKKKKRCMIM